MNEKYDSKTIVQWLWLDMGHTQIAQHILEWGKSPVINMSDNHFYTYFNMRYLGDLPFKHLKMLDGSPTSMSSRTPLSEILRWAHAGRSAAGASKAVGISDIGAYFNASILPIMLAQSGADPKVLSKFGDTDRLVVAPMAYTHTMPEMRHYITFDSGAQLQPTLYMCILNLSPVLSRCWLARPELLSQSKSILLDMLPGIERSQIYGPVTKRHDIKDCLTAAEFNLGVAIWTHYNVNAENRREKITIPIINILSNGSTTTVNGEVSLNSVFQEIMDYVPSCVIVWTNNNSHDMVTMRSNNGCTKHTETIMDSDEDYALEKREDKKMCNDKMLRSNAVLARMLYNDMRTRGELKRHEIIRSPLFSILEKNRDKEKRSIYRKHCGSSVYHYITDTERYRSTLISSKPKADAAASSVLGMLSEQLAAAKL